MRVAWITDPHLPASPLDLLEGLCATISDAGPEVVLVGGDIGNAASFASLLGAMEELLRRPIYFVLGNHDFYGASMADVRRQASELSKRARWLRWLSLAGVVRLTNDTGLLGHDSWADGRLGNAFRSTVLLNDYVLVTDFMPLGQAARFRKLNQLGDEAARHFATHLPAAVSAFKHLVVLTHVPPFREAAWYEGRISDDDWLPHFSCKAVGDVLVEVMSRHPDCRMTVLCGHTHGEGEARILENLRVLTGGAEYGKPRIQRVLEVA